MGLHWCCSVGHCGAVGLQRGAAGLQCGAVWEHRAAASVQQRCSVALARGATDLIRAGAVDLGAEVADVAVQRALHFQLRLHAGRVLPPLGRFQAPQVLLHPALQFLHVAQRRRLLLLLLLGPRAQRRRRGVGMQGVLGAQRHQALVQAVDAAVHLLALRVPPVLQRLHVGEEGAQHAVRLLQVALQLRRALRRLPGRLQAQLLRRE